ncbi:MAG TPA: ATPase domain-containing protein [Thermoplasmata archaeon]
MIREKVKTGITGLDEMLDGGLIPGRLYLVSGTSGTGKTTLAMRFLMEGAQNGERVMYVAVDEPPNEVRENMRSYGWDISRVHVFDGTPDVMSYDKTPVRDVSTERRVQYFQDVSKEIRKTSDRAPADMTVNTLQEMLRQEMKERRYTRMAIDSLTSLRYFYIRTSEENTSLISFLRVLSDLGITTLVTVQLPEISKPDVEAHIARGEIRLHKWFDGRGLIRGVTIEKLRGSKHDDRLRSMKVTTEGIVVKPSVPMREGTGADEESAEPPPPPDEAPQGSAQGQPSQSPQEIPKDQAAGIQGPSETAGGPKQ